MKLNRWAVLCFGCGLGVAFGAFAIWKLFNSGDQIAFVSNRQGGHEIYLVHTSGPAQWIGPRQLSGNQTWENVLKRVAPLLEPLLNRPLIGLQFGERSSNNTPAWSPTRQQVAYTAYRAELRSEIHILNLSGVKQASTSSSYDKNPVWSSDGRMAFTSFRDVNYEIYVMNADGSAQTNLTHNPAYDADPAWSPNGRRIAFVSNRDDNGEIYVMNDDGSAPRRLTHNLVSDTHPVWSPDGQRIAYVSDEGGNSEIYVINADGSGQTNLTRTPADDTDPIWSPDGAQLAFASYRSGNSEIYVVNVPNELPVENLPTPTNLTQNAAYDWNPVWSPDGKRLAFVSDRDGNFEIYVMNADGSDQKNLTQNSSADTDPVWRP
jgi:Tol biopolymer transport system component